MAIENHPINQLNAKGAPDLVTHQADRLLADAIAHFEAHTGRKLSPSEVEMYLLETIAYMLSVRGAEEQTALENNFIAYARPEYLDKHGADRQTPRLPASAATTKLRFSVTGAASSWIRIPEGTRVSDAAGQVQFETQTAAFIEVGQTHVDVKAQATYPGQYANGYALGTVTALIDPVPGVDAVSNLTETGAGADRESDARYRVRLAQVFERIGYGLSRERYVDDVLSWNARCIDVSVERPQPGYVNLYPLMSDGAPNAEELASLRAVFDGSNTHQGDYIRAFAPTAHSFSVSLKLFLETPDAQAPARTAVQAVLDKWRLTLGGHIAPSQLIHAAKGIDGVVEADVPGLSLTKVASSAYRAGQIASVTVELV